LKVAARSASLPYRNRTVAPADLGRELNVGSVLEGTVQRMGDRLRISAFLSDTSDGRELWSERYDRDASDIFALQDDIAASVVNSLRVTLSGLDHRAMVKRPTASVEAYQLYLRGRHLWNHRQAGSTQKAIQCFREALEIDPLYALPYAGLADAFASLGAYEYMRPIDAFPKATASAERALSLDATLAEAHTTLGVAQAHYAWDWRAGEQSYLEAIALNPRYALAHTYYALLLSATGRHERAADAIARAAEIDPISVPIITIKGYVAYYARRYDDAIHDYRIALDMDPSFGLAMVLLGYANLSRGQYDESIRVFRAIPSPRLTSIGGLGIALSLTGRTDEARALLAQMEGARTTEYISAFTLSQVHLGLGDRETALSLLESAVAERSYNLSFVASAQPFDSLRGEPRFAAVLKSIGLEHVPGALVRP
ncbi:MAG: tetratricopeptide repeat protein, partial [Gemmatimonadaceae bacterium]